jgi:hypothetical protein
MTSFRSKPKPEPYPLIVYIGWLVLYLFIGFAIMAPSWFQ